MNRKIVLLFVLFPLVLEAQDGPFSFNGKTTIFTGNALHWDATQDASSNLVWSSWSNRFFKINGTTFRQDGRVGIGVTSPVANLQIGESTMNGLLNLGGYSFLGSLKSSGDFFAGVNVYAEYTSSAEDSKIKVFGNSLTGFSAMQMGFNGDINFYVKPGAVVANEQVNVDSYNVFKISRQGNVSIGTTDPKGYKLAVAGKAIAEEIVVKLQANWPDYVFEETYQLPSLTEVARYIKQHKHLPEIPSAKEMEENGVLLGEMNMMLLKKIEELTLYVIELKQENERLKIYENELKELKESVERLNEAINQK